MSRGSFKDDRLLFYGLPIFGYSPKRQAGVSRNENVLRFKEHYGCTAGLIFTDLKAKYQATFWVKDALMTLTVVSNENFGPSKLGPSKLRPLFSD
jgi:hypothetical protein